ncbi:MAG TPA: hypothetical protein VNX21_02405 [Candidatus Thermoplasmatota archaeon]|nr:hypothetical protein [Candidatus Thermoplasmatota archaeon]
MLARRAIALGLVLLLPAALANHTPPGNDTVDGGKMWCDKDVGGTANSQTLPILRTTDNGHLVIEATGSAARGLRCEFAVKITHYTLPGGSNPQGGILNVASTPCWASGSTCTAVGETDWWVTFVDPVNGVFTPEIDVHFTLVVNGVPVDNGVVRIVEPSLPLVRLP